MFFLWQAETRNPKYKLFVFVFCNTKYTKLPPIINLVKNNKENNDDQQIRAPFDGIFVTLFESVFCNNFGGVRCATDEGSALKAESITLQVRCYLLVYVKTWLPLLQMPHLVGKGGLVLAAVVNGSPPELAPNPNTPAGTTIDALVGISVRYGKVGVTRSVTMSHVR
ncbi:hypothetical protein RHGRI_011096 [Rhododendron griersonianum]|uniref:Uncharacterized protein n=1 Tax=Rhododendron griersonianum TaxID=479676 RepID=A0AAV6KKQ9_9ERIC|nr:hypothetical protein RHGRI_011096 [Rhododendron griersonianum]